MRPQDEVERYLRNDPIPKMRARLSEHAASRIEAEAARRVESAVEWARRQPFPDPASLQPPQPGARAELPR